jgi:hypothetical protein
MTAAYRPDRSENLHLNVSPLLAPPEAGVDAGVWASWLPGVVILTAPAGRQVVEGQGVQDMALEAARGQYTCSRVLSVRASTCIKPWLAHPRASVEVASIEAAVYPV